MGNIEAINYLHNFEFVRPLNSRENIAQPPDFIMSSSSDSPASTAAFAIAAAIIAGVSGFFFGQASSLGLLGTKTNNTQGDRRPHTSRAGNVTSSGDSDLSEGHENVTDDETELQDFGANNEECKLVLVVRTDLGMTKGTSSAISSLET